jgi:nucleoside-triphosphatase THEP1
MPKTGKSTLLQKVIMDYPDKVGFVTREIKVDGQRVGFEIVNHSNESTVFASTTLTTDVQVSKYFADIPALEHIIPSVTHFSSNDVLYLDEIGQMQLHSKAFQELTTTYLNSPNMCIATLSKIYSDSFTEHTKKRNDIILVELDGTEFEAKETYVSQLMQKILKAQKYISDPSRFSPTESGYTIRTDHGERHLSNNKSLWQCDCEFFSKFLICSHVISVEEIEADINK